MPLHRILVSGGTNDGQNVQEDVDYIQVQVEGCEDVFLGGDAVLVLASHHQLGVVDQVEGEQQSAQRRVHQRYYVVARDEYGDKTKDEQHDSGTQQHAAHHCEVPLGLQREQREREAYRRRYTHCHQHSINVVDARGDT